MRIMIAMLSFVLVAVSLGGCQQHRYYPQHYNLTPYERQEYQLAREKKVIRGLGGALYEPNL